MIKSLFRDAFRSLFKRGSFTLINIVGLSVGITVFFMLFVYVVYENSYDTFIEDADNIYRVELDVFRNEKPLLENATSTYSIGPLLKEHVAGVKQYARAGFERCLIFRDKQSFNDQQLFWVDSTFLTTVNVEMLRGDARSALARPYTTVLSEKMAQTFFGDQDAVGKVIFVNEHLRFTVTGVFKTLPENSHFNFRLLLSLSTGNVLWPGWGTNNRSWGNQSWLYTYIQLEKGADVAEVEQKMDAKVAELFPEQLKGENYRYKYHLKPIREIHLTSSKQNEFKVNGSEQNVKLLLLIAILILVVVWINYINIASSEAFDKAREIGIRKINGSSKKHIVIQSFIEVLILNLISLVITFILIQLVSNLFETIFDVPITKYLVEHTSLYLILLLVVFCGTFLSGIYPAVVMSSFNPLRVMKGNIFFGANRFVMRKSLLIIQMVITIVLVISAITIYQQIRFMQSADLGFTKESVIALPAPCTLNMDSTKQRRFFKFKKQLLTNASVKSVSSSMFDIGGECLSVMTFNRIEDKPISGVTCYRNGIDDDYLETYGISLLAGRNLKIEDRNKILLNEAACNEFGFTSALEAIGKTISVAGEQRATIVGVVRNFNQESLKRIIKPMVLYNDHPFQFGIYSVKVLPTNISNTIEYIRQEWEASYPNAPFLYHFVDRKLEQLYQKEERFGKMIVIFTVLAILIAGLGLLGIVVIVLRKKVKEIGIRKVNGAKIHEVMYLLNRDFIIWMLLAFVISCPIAWYSLQLWLENFAYRIDVGFWVFALSGLFVFLITLLTVSIRSYRAAVANPVDSLRYE